MKSTILLPALFFLLNLGATNSGNLSYPTPSDVVQQYLSAVDAGDFTTVATLLADDCQVSAPFAPQSMSKKSWLGACQALNMGFPGMEHQVTMLLEFGQTVVARGQFIGQNNGEFMDNPPTGNTINCSFNTIFQLDNYWKIKAIFVEFDQKNLENQLKAGLPDPIAAAEASIRGIMEAADAGNIELLANYFDPLSKHYFNGQPHSMEDFKSRTQNFKTAFPDIRRNLEVVSSVDGIVTAKGWLTGTQQGTFMGIPASGNKIRVAVIAVYHFNRYGKVTESWVVFDGETLGNQLKSTSPHSKK